MNLSISLTVNGVRQDVELEDPRVTLHDLLRERLDLTGTKKGCDRGQCGACTVLIDGRRINSCLALAVRDGGLRPSSVRHQTSSSDDWRPCRRFSIPHSCPSPTHPTAFA